MTQFDSLGLAPSILKTIEKLGYETPTPIQVEAIPLVLEGRDLIGLAQTGTGKTAAFGLPLIHHLLSEKERPEAKTVRALILAPTRELASQIATNLRDFVRHTHLRIGVVFGGASIHFQKKNLERGTDILVATPGRLLDLVERKALRLDTAKYLVLDEADQMLDLGFIVPLRKIAALLGTPRQTLLFSATMPKQVEQLSQAYLNNPVRVATATSGRAVEKINQTVHFVSQPDKAALLKACLAEREDDLSLVFSRTKHGAEKLMKQLVARGFKAGSIHGNKSQGQRTRAIKAFKDGEIRVLVATDVAARGIDISGVTHVYNFNLPEVPENYVHRIGRTARAGASGKAIAFCAPEEFQLLRDIEKLMGKKIETEGGERPADPVGRSFGKGKKRSRSKSRFNPKAGGRQKTAKWSPDRAAGADASAPGGQDRRRQNSETGETRTSPDNVVALRENAGQKFHKPGGNNNPARPGKRRRIRRKPAA